MERIKQNIEQLVEDEYKLYGVVGHATQVEVREGDKIIITLNTEEPFMGLKFWKFLDSLNNKFEELGYKKKDGNFCFDFYTVEYVK
jgi:hypothetical protein